MAQFKRGNDFISNRDQIRFLKYEKQRLKNFDDQHGWKLRINSFQLSKCLQAKFEQQRELLNKQHLCENSDRSKNTQKLSDLNIAQCNYGGRLRFSSMGTRESPRPGVKRLSRDQQAKLKENLTKKIHLQARLKPISKVMAQTSEKYKITNPSLATRNQVNLTAVPPPPEAGL